MTLVFLAVSAAACGGGESPPDAGGSSTSAKASAPSGLTADELEFGIGPIRSLDLGDLDTTLGAVDDFYVFMSGGFSGNVTVHGLPAG